MMRKHVLIFCTLIGALAPAGAHAGADNPLCPQFPVQQDATNGVGPFHGGPNCYFTTSDGIEIGMEVIFPKGFSTAASYPTILEMAGYENGSSSPDGKTTLGQAHDVACDTLQPGHCTITGFPLSGDSQDGTSAFRYTDAGTYVLVHASVRGTGCSQGTFDLFSQRSAMDGYEIIESYIAKQSWSNGTVGILGHSYSGLTGTMVAAQEGMAAREGRSNHLVALNVSGLIDDLYRGITFPGGVFNGLFPPEWTLGVRPAYDVLGGTGQGIFRNANNIYGQECAKNLATHNRTVINDPVLQGAITDVDNDWFHTRSMITYAPFITVPTIFTGGFNDEQTGPRGPAHLWEAIAASHKRLIISNGDHGTNVDPYNMWADRKAWMDHFMRGDVNPFVDAEATPHSVRTLFGLHGCTAAEKGETACTPGMGGQIPSGIKDSAGFPLPDTLWTPYFFCNGNKVLPGPAVCAGSAQYVSGTKRQSWSYETGPDAGAQFAVAKGPDEIDLTGPTYDAPVAIDGPVTATLFLSSTANDTQMFVQIADEDVARGQISFLARGLLKASHNAIDPLHSDYDALHADPLDAAKPFLYRPYRPHTNPQNITPGAVNSYLIEIPPVAHVFQPGHRLVVKVMAPPAVDSQYSYVPKEMPAALNTVYFDAERPSRVTLPIVPIDFTLGAWPSCGNEYQVRCVSE